MKITEMKVNHIIHPLGYDLSAQTLSWKYDLEGQAAQDVADVAACAVKIAKDIEFENIIYDSKSQNMPVSDISDKMTGHKMINNHSDQISNAAYELNLKLEPRTRYYWQVQVKLSDGKRITSDTDWFETGKLDEAWQAQWICMPDDFTGILTNENFQTQTGFTDRKRQPETNAENTTWEPVEADLEHITEKSPSPVVRKVFEIKKMVASARAYVTGLGLYECYVNGKMQNDGYFQPGFNHYNYWLQYQTLDITDALKNGKNNLSFLIGDGWYKGRFGVNGGFENNFGTQNHLLCEIRIRYEDGSEDIIGTDESFEYAPGPVQFSNIYDGEIYDATKADIPENVWHPAVLKTPEKIEKLTERWSLPVVVKNKLKPVAVLTGPKGEKILDMGQNMTGWLVFKDNLKVGQTVTLRFAELLKDGALCTDNLLTSKNTAFVYTSAGAGTDSIFSDANSQKTHMLDWENKITWIRPHFTYFGFRYVQLEGFSENISVDDFEGWNIYSDLPMTGEVKTDNADVNQLISNALWSQRDNFLEHPTDCPQRAERLGWTGDAQIYYKTASYFMDTTAFFRKYMKDVNEEQMHRSGLVPFIIPKIKGRGFSDPNAVECSAAWSDVATVVPWMMYVYYGDKNLLKEQYPGMKAWVQYMMQEDEKDGNKHLYQTGFHFGDWLALDNPEPGPFGKTDAFYIASAYYMYSTKLTAKAARVLGLEADAALFEARAKAINEAILSTYFDENGICKIDTQTAYAVAIHMEIVTGEAAMKNGILLAEKIKANNMHLDTGFVGTPYLCLALTKANQYDTAVKLLLQKEIPGWLGEVRLGATTIWEAWDALDEQGHLTGDASLNHYAYGSVVEWIFSDVCGIKPLEDEPGFKKVLMHPHPTKALGSVEALLNTAYGKYEIAWHYEDDTPHVKVTVPYGGQADLIWQENLHSLKAGIYEF